MHHMEQMKFDSPKPQSQGPVECLGLTFDNDEARRQYYTNLLREGLEELHAKLGQVSFTTIDEAVEHMRGMQKWPMGSEDRLRDLASRMAKSHREARDKDLLQLWKDEVGFPHGTIDDIIQLSDPPYYTACPNPFIQDFIDHYGKPYDPETDDYRREPYAADVSEGKNDPIYNAHSYHTKVPHKAIMRFILHYTEPGDVVFDGFAGTGMTGVAAQMCGDRETVQSLGYKVDDEGVIYEQETDENGKGTWKAFSKLGVRRAVLNDLSPAATFIAYNYNRPVDVQAFEREAKRILKEVEEECGWMYATLADAKEGEAEEWAAKLRASNTVDEIRDLVNSDPSAFGRINYTVWSDVFVCSDCTEELVFHHVGFDTNTGRVRNEFPCPHCSATLHKRNMERAWVTRYDEVMDSSLQQTKQLPVLVNYSVAKTRREKDPDIFDQVLIEKIEQLETPFWFPSYPMMFKGERWGDSWRAGYHAGITHVHHFYTKRNLWALAALYQLADRSVTDLNRISKFFVQYACLGFSKLARYVPTHFSQVNQYLSGTLYIGSQQVEVSPSYILSGKLDRMVKRELVRPYAGVFGLATADASAVIDNGEAVDYIFTDPPFGSNLMYSELNFLWESWLKVFTNNKPEAIENAVQGKGLPEYQRLMTESFKEYYRILKPGRWMTVEFHNSKNSVWNAIQESLQAAGFVVADVRILDKKQGSFKQVMSTNAVKQDLIISCYKPNGGLEERFKLTASTEEGLWDFVRTHLNQLPVFVAKDGKSEVIAERQNYLLYDRIVAFYVQRGAIVPLSAAEVYAGLEQRFPQRDGMYFLPDQAAEYDRRRMTVKEVLQLQLFVNDEASAIQWLKQQLTRKPQTFQELNPDFMREISGWQKHEKQLELLDLLGENFLRFDGQGPIPKQIVSWMRQSAELRRLIDTALESGQAGEDALGLRVQDARLIDRAKGRWYVPDPNQAADIEKLRERALLREFEEYRESKQKRLREFRLEAVRAGFKKAWQDQDYQTIISVAERIPQQVLQEDPKLLMWYDQAVTRTEGRV